MDVVYVKWVDTVTDHDVWKAEEATNDFFDRTDNVVHQVGYLYRDDEDYLCLVSAYMPSDDIGEELTMQRTKIPKKWILKQTILLRDKKKKDEIV
jgi:hypothetical protein